MRDFTIHIKNWLATMGPRCFFGSPLKSVFGVKSGQNLDYIKKNKIWWDMRS